MGALHKDWQQLGGAVSTGGGPEPMGEMDCGQMRQLSRETRGVCGGQSCPRHLGQGGGPCGPCLWRVAAGHVSWVGLTKAESGPEGSPGSLGHALPPEKGHPRWVSGVSPPGHCPSGPLI